MDINVLDTVVLQRNLPEQRLKQGDIGTVVELYEPDGVEVEFVTNSGHTQALETLSRVDVRPTNDKDIQAVRSLNAA